MYKPETNTPFNPWNQGSPVLDVTWIDGVTAVCGTLGQCVNKVDLNTPGSAPVTLGHHQGGVKAVAKAGETLVASGGWDSVLKLWDIRAASPEVAAASQPDKVDALSTTGHYLLVGHRGRTVWVYDMRHGITKPIQNRESNLKYQTRTIVGGPDGEGYIQTSVEGRVAVEIIDASEQAQKAKYAFRCHRTKTGGVETVHPVNAVAYHPIYGTFATGGGDGMVNIWDGTAKKRVCQLPVYPTSISSLSFNQKGTHMAVAASYTFEGGEKDHPPDAIFWRPVADSEVAPKK